MTNHRGAALRTSTRQQARTEARERQRKEAIRGRQIGPVKWALTAVAVLGAAAFLITHAVQSQPGRVVPIQAAQHIEKGMTHAPYNSTPPTSGPHWNVAGEAPVDWGIYDSPIPDEAQVHNLEHGGIMIQYNCDCPNLAAQLRDLYNRWAPTHQLKEFPASTKIVVAPYPNMPTQIALTAWGHIDTFEGYDEERIVRFIEAFRDHGPEAVM